MKIKENEPLNPQQLSKVQVWLIKEVGEMRLGNQGSLPDTAFSSLFLQKAKHHFCISIYFPANRWHPMHRIYSTSLVEGKSIIQFNGRICPPSAIWTLPIKTKLKEKTSAENNLANLCGGPLSYPGYIDSSAANILYNFLMLTLEE